MCDNESYALASSEIVQEGRTPDQSPSPFATPYSEESTEVSDGLITGTSEPHIYQPLDLSTRIYSEPLMADNFHFDDITLENISSIQQLAATNPNQLQLFLLVKMQRMLLEIQMEKHSVPQQKSHAEASYYNAEQMPVDSPSLEPKEASKAIVYSTLSFEDEYAVENVKLALGELQGTI